MLIVQTSIKIKAPAAYLSALYQNVDLWSSLFPRTISEARLLKEENGKLTIKVQHKKAGEVINILSVQSPEEISLEEFKPLYQAVFNNRFQPENGGALYQVTARIKLKGIFKIAEPFIKTMVAKRINNFVLEPMKKYAEAHYQH